jgi:hypothetical protein
LSESDPTILHHREAGSVLKAHADAQWIHTFRKRVK